MIKTIQKLKNKKGFTLVELIVVIAIIAILTAVIVPLVARYSAQAQYTALQDTANTIGSSASTAMADANQKNVVTAEYIWGVKSGSTFTVSVGGAEVNASVTNFSDNGNQRAAEKLWQTLSSALTGDCTFYITVKNSAVEGVVYSNDKTAPAYNVSTIAKVDGYDYAYASETKTGTAIGVSGIYLEQTSVTKPASYKAPASSTPPAKQDGVPE